MLTALRSIAEPTRFAILQLVRHTEMSSGDIAANFRGISRPAVSQHLSILKKAGLITERRKGTSRIYRLRSEGFEPIKALLTSFWDSKLEK
ncbi:MAG TPA: ArsR family transcriptional regulator [Nitrospinaceae bacterium]|nr:ArsR family transcriptional regulator [Nitrospinaceae bacterium]